MIDSHAHLDDPAFDEDRGEVLERAARAGVSKIVVPGVGPAQWPRLEATRARHPMLSFAVGLHPQLLPELEASEIDAALGGLSAAARSLSAIAIGECGLDGGVAQGDEGVAFEVQRRCFVAQLEVADSLGLPVILHILGAGAHGEALALLEERGPLRRGGVVHSYSGSAELVPRYCTLGLYISFAGGITRARARRPIEAARAVPLERLLVETDAPDQAPDGVGSTRNEPAHLGRMIDALALARGISRERVAAVTADNAARLFAL